MTPLKTIRMQKGMTQAELALKVGVTQAHICGLEGMTERASPDLAEKLVRALGRRSISEEQILYPTRFQKRTKRKAA